MAINNFRIKCNCGLVQDAAAGAVCPQCKQPINFPQGGMIYLYRKGSPMGVAGGFGIYINGTPLGLIGNKQTVAIPVGFGTYNLHVAAGMNRKCKDLAINITPENPIAYAKVYMKPGFWTNSFVVEPSTQEEMPL
ncbi:MAG: hypothetical protein IJ346_06420 [Clostridia bacterium]|nr:hypothetical protein [Clostridia bacterium]